jgi:tryptophan synthase beta chain
MPQQADQLPDKIYACVGGGSNALGMFLPFLDYPQIELVGVEAGGKGVNTEQHAVRINKGSVGVAQGYKTYFRQNDDGQMLPTHSIAAGLDYIGISPILSYLADQKRIRFTHALDEEVLAAALLLIKKEGIIPALESSHAIAKVIEEAPKLSKDQVILFNLSGRGDKDIFNFAEAVHDQKWIEFLKSKII